MEEVGHLFSFSQVLSFFCLLTQILHVSDVHYEIPSWGCDDVLLSQLPCDERNSTAFLAWLIETEKPDVVIHTGDVIDWATYTAERGMTEYYNISFAHAVPWAASLGNHDDDSPTMPRRKAVLDFILTLPGTLTEVVVSPRVVLPH
jgi:metallophosphoesterase superfamily enzyme